MKDQNIDKWLVRKESDVIAGHTTFDIQCMNKLVFQSDLIHTKYEDL